MQLKTPTSTFFKAVSWLFFPLVLMACSKPQIQDAAHSGGDTGIAQDQQQSDLKSSEQSNHTKPINPEMIQSCKEKGGEMIRGGFAQYPFCLIKSKDAGKSCRDNQECENKCLALQDKDTGFFPDAGTVVTGRCQADNAPWGCRQTVTDGKADPGLCID